MLDLGATVCTARSPSCGASCPVVRLVVRRVVRRAVERHPEPDPAVGSAGVSGRQARFEGSDRQLRGRLLRAAARGSLADITSSAGADRERVDRMLAGLVADGLLVRRDDGHQLP